MSTSWRITFVDTGLNATIGERLKAVGPYLTDDEAFLATYGDGLTDATLPDVIRAFHERQKIAMFLSVRPQFNAHLVVTDEAGTVVAVEDMSRSHVRVNGGSLCSGVRSSTRSSPVTSWSRRHSPV